MVRVCLFQVLALALLLSAQAFLPPSRCRPVTLYLRSTGGKDGGATKKGYQFGDISRRIAKQAAEKIKKVTKKDKYEFGDLSRHLDRQAKRRVADSTGSEEYEFGDLTRFAMSSLQSHVSNFTSQTDSDGKPTYQFGDVTREILRRAQSGEYEAKDLFLALRVLLSAGVGLTPMVSMLPVRWVLDLVNLGLAQDLGGRLVEVLASSLDERAKLAITGNPKYQLGDLSKRKLVKAISAFTGKEEYEFGDISQRLMTLNDRKAQSESSVESRKATQNAIVLDDDTAAALEDWDRRFQVEDLR
jgi:hypothetical protein